ncbi:FAD-dependent oxidoreductase [Maricurvus nonylphenolicus]|uniref:FAD-dependent monooxygenase n=1 Tax=Maricurvus nonylphenolicus TaxID=1008307 RepID=UPI0036F2827C
MQTSNKKSDASVLIVGGGPVGLSLAIELCSWGIKPIVVEKRTPDELIYPTANHLSVRGAELLRRWGLVDELRENGFNKDWDAGVGVFTHLGGYEIRRLVRHSNADSFRPPYSPENEMWQPKRYVDPLLRKTALERGAVIVSPAEVISQQQDNDGVTTEVKYTRTGETEEFRTDYAVGCDGANSKVRDWLDMELEGLPPQEPRIDSVYFECEELANTVVPRWHYKLLGNAEGPHGEGGWMIAAIDGDKRWRLHGPGVVDLEDTEVTKANLKNIVGIEGDIKVISQGSWQLRQALTPTFQKGRVFLAGDAAARGTTFGGLWMMRGMIDAVDLGWKLAATLQGWGGDKLLDSFSAERRDATLQLLLFQGADLSGPKPEVVLQRAFGHADALPNPPPMLWEEGKEADELRQAAIDHFNSNNSNEFDFAKPDVGYRYDQSPIIIDDGSALPEVEEGGYEQNAKPGGRAPHAWLEDGKSTLDWFNQSFTLINLSGEHPATLLQAAQERGLPLSVQSRVDPKLQELFEQPYILVRPDSIVAWRGSLPDLNEAYRIIDTVRGA